MSDTLTGQCLCGGVRYAIRGRPRSITACHCSQCRRTSGHHVAMTSAAAADLTLFEQTTLTWYRSSQQAERGFCNRCGGNLFWRSTEAGAAISISAGTLDSPTGLKLDRHIFVEDKGDYYDLIDTLPKYPQSD